MTVQCLFPKISKEIIHGAKNEICGLCENEEKKRHVHTSDDNNDQNNLIASRAGRRTARHCPL